MAFLSTGGGRGDPPFLEALREHGYVPGQNMTLERYAPQSGKFEEMPAIAARLIATRPDVILASNPYSLDSVLKATKTIPVVGVDLESDPVARGWVASLARRADRVIE